MGRAPGAEVLDEAGAVADEDLDAPHPLHWRATAPLFDIVVLVANHWTYHAGEINAILSIYMTQFLRFGEAEATSFHSLFKSGAYFFPVVGAIVSDVGSVKGAVLRDMAPHLPAGIHFVAAHPVAGTEYSGPDAGFCGVVAVSPRGSCAITNTRCS